MLECDSNLFEDLQNGSRFSDIIAIRDSVNKININKYLSFLPHNFDLLSIDTDGDNDYECLEAMKARPKIVIVEINSSFGPEVVGRKDCYSEMVGLALTWKGYFLLCHTGNLVFVDNKYKELFPELLGTNGISNPELYFNTSWLTK
jgi:hypothetical protein